MPHLIFKRFFMNKKTIYFLGLVTLILFPALALSVLWFFSSKNPIEVLEITNFLKSFSFIGFLFGTIYALISLWVFGRPYFEGEMYRQKKLILSLKLKFLDKLFLSFCAGFGEEILFRSGMQHYLGIILTSFIFVAIHGYLNPKRPRLALYGLFLMPFILLLGYGLEYYGVWFCIFAHMSYDLILFLALKEEPEPSPFLKKVRIN